MTTTKLLFTAAAAALMAGAVQAAPVQWTSGSGGNDHWYELVGSLDTWSGAKAAAAGSSHLGMSGYLATVTSAAEQAFLNSLNPQGHGAWLGGTDEVTEGVWQWITGEAWSYSNWNGGEPNNLGNEDYLVGWWSGDRWNDLPNGSRNYYVVEYDGGIAPVPLPAGLPLVLGGLGLLGFASRRRKSR